MATQIFCRLFPKTLTSLTSFRSMTTRATILSLIERLNHSPNSSALKLRNGYDYIRTTVLMHKYKIGPFEREPTATELVHDYVKLLTDLVGSEEEARMMVYSYGLNSDFNYAGTLLPNELYLDLYYRGLGGTPGIIIMSPDYSFSNLDEMSLVMPLDHIEKMVREDLANEEEFSRRLLTRQGIDAA